MKRAGARVMKNFLGGAILVLALGYDLAGWGLVPGWAGPGDCVGCTARGPSYVNTGMCGQVQCNAVVGGGCFDPCQDNVNWYCTDNHQTQLPYTACSFTGNGNCTTTQGEANVNYGVDYNCY